MRIFLLVVFLFMLKSVSYSQSTSTKIIDPMKIPDIIYVMKAPSSIDKKAIQAFIQSHPQVNNDNRFDVRIVNEDYINEMVSLLKIKGAKGLQHFIVVENLLEAYQINTGVIQAKYYLIR